MHGAYRRMVLRPQDISGSIQEDNMKVAFSLGLGAAAL